MTVVADETPRVIDERSDIADIVRCIQAGDSEAVSELYAIMRRGIWFVFFRDVRNSADDLVHEVFIDVIAAIRSGELKQPAAVAGYARVIAQRKRAAMINTHALARARQRDESSPEYLSLADHTASPEQSAYDQERRAIAQRAMSALRPREREILERFYIREQPADEIQAAMRLTETQFWLLKSRAKAKFANTGIRLHEDRTSAPVRRRFAAARAGITWFRSRLASE